MPTTPQQWLGTGFGPGHHAPLVLGPWCDSRPASPGVYRIRQTEVAAVHPYPLPMPHQMSYALPPQAVRHRRFPPAPPAGRPHPVPIRLPMPTDVTEPAAAPNLAVEPVEDLPEPHSAPPIDLDYQSPTPGEVPAEQLPLPPI